MPKIKPKIRREDHRPSRISVTGFTVIFWALIIDIMALMLWFFTIFTLGLTAPLQIMPPILGMMTLGLFHWFVVDSHRTLDKKLVNLIKKLFLGWVPFYWTA